MKTRAVDYRLDRPKPLTRRNGSGAKERARGADRSRGNGGYPWPEGLPGATLAQEGDYWTLVYNGIASRLRDLRGLHYLAHLLHHPGQEFHVLDLAWRRLDALDGELDSRRVCSSEARHPILDNRAKAAYRRHVEELRDELAEAERFNDSGRAEQARAEIAAVTRHLAMAVGFGGRDRAARTAAERARGA